MRPLPLLLALLLLASLAAPGGAPARTGIRTVAVMPFGVYASQGRPTDVTDAVSDALRARGFSVLPKGELEAYRIRRRIRRAEFMDRAALRGLGLELNVDAVVMGKADMAFDEVPSATVAAQMVECGDARMVWAGMASHSGADGALLLELGAVRDMDALLARVMADLLRTLPAEAYVNESSGPDVAVARAGFQPEVLRGGDRARLVVELRPGDEESRTVRAYLLDKEIPLRREGPGRFGGEIEAPMVERVYPLRLFVADAWSHLEAVETDAVLTVDNSPLAVSVDLRDTEISPNGDGVRDRLLFTADVGDMRGVGGWNVRILDATGRAVRTDQGHGPLPDVFTWDGMDNTGHLLADGEYFCVLALTDRAGNSAEARPGRVVVDTTAPDVSALLAPDQDGRIVVELAGEATADVRLWELILHRADGTVMARFRGRGAPPATLEARGLSGERPVAYSVEALDRAGNRQRMELVPLAVRVPVPQETDLPEREVWINDF